MAVALLNSTVEGLEIAHPYRGTPFLTQTEEHRDGMLPLTILSSSIARANVSLSMLSCLTFCFGDDGLSSLALMLHGWRQPDGNDDVRNDAAVGLLPKASSGFTTHDLPSPQDEARTSVTKPTSSTWFS